MLADLMGAELIRLQCYEGLDVSNAVYEWNFTRQMLYLRTLEATGTASRRAPAALADIFGPDFLLRGRCCRRSSTAATGRRCC